MSRAAALSTGVALVVCAVFAFVGPERPGSYVFEDHRVGSETVALMKHGAGYYAAMDRAMTDAGVGPVAEPRSFRPPTLFLLWRLLPGRPPHALWVPFVLMVAVTAVLLAMYTTAPVVVPLVALYLLASGRHTYGGIYLMVELWVPVFTAAVLLCWRQRRRRVAAAFAFVAFAVRELTAGLLVAGLVVAWRRREDWRPWLAALAGAVAFTALHWHLAGSFLVRHGHEAPLIGTARFPESILESLSFLLPGPRLLWLVVWGLAVYNLVRTRELGLVVLYVALPLTALSIHRPYWGFLTIPFVMVWAAEAVQSRLAMRA